jgi:hypothetical protein
VPQVHRQETYCERATHQPQFDQFRIASTNKHLSLSPPQTFFRSILALKEQCNSVRQALITSSYNITYCHNVSGPTYRHNSELPLLTLPPKSVLTFEQDMKEMEALHGNLITPEGMPHPSTPHHLYHDTLYVKVSI